MVDLATLMVEHDQIAGPEVSPIGLRVLERGSRGLVWVRCHTVRLDGLRATPEHARDSDPVRVGRLVHHGRIGAVSTGSYSTVAAIRSDRRLPTNSTNSPAGTTVMRCCLECN